VTVWEKNIPSQKVLSVLFFVSGSSLAERLLERSKTSGRNDDNLDTIRYQAVVAF
jgi:hypothetical protein